MKKIDERFVSELSIQEKAILVSGDDFWFTNSIEHLNIPRIMLADGPSGLRKQADGADALGLSGSVEAVSFPGAALTASSFDENMIYQLGKNLGIAAKHEKISILLGPGINIKRSPLGGRNFEYFSEDPHVSSRLGAAYIDGVQSEGVGVSLKHFALNNRENQRFTASSNVDERTLREIYLSAFEYIVKTNQPATVMCSYNAINGTLASENHRLLTEILREEWGFKGAVISDWSAVANNVSAIKAGLDLEMPGEGDNSSQKIIEAIHSGELSEEILNTAVLRILKLVENFKSLNSGTTNYNKEEQHNFARKLASDGMILLKNKDDILPLSKNDHIAIIGDLAKHPRYQGGGSSHVNEYNLSTPLSAAKNIFKSVSYSQGYKIDDNDIDLVMEQEAIKFAQKNKKVIVFLGLPESLESEGFDKENIDLPKNQISLINNIAKYNKNIIVVLQNGSAITMPWKNQVKGILETYLAGEAVGEATWDVISGSVNPSGKLAETFPIRLEDNPTFGTFDSSKEEEVYHEGIFVGYRYYDMKKCDVNFPFGFGLSYTSFEYKNIRVELLDKEVVVSLDIKNVGKRKGKEVVQLYVQNKASQVEVAINSLQAFSKVEIDPGETKSVEFTLSNKNFSRYDVDLNKWIMDNGEYYINIGSSSRDIQQTKKIVLNNGTKPKKEINSETYISEIINRKDLEKYLTASGIQKFLDTIMQNSTGKDVLLNMPLRSLIMVGANIDNINYFIKLANGKQDA